MPGHCRLVHQERIWWNLNQNSIIFIKKMHSKMSSTRMAAILSRGRWVNCPPVIYRIQEVYAQFKSHTKHYTCWIACALCTHHICACLYENQICPPYVSMFTLDPGRSQVTMYVHLVADIGSITMRLLIPRLVKNAAMVATVYVIVLLYVHKSKLSIINLCSNSLQNQVDMCQLCPHWWHRWLSLR